MGTNEGLVILRGVLMMEKVIRSAPPFHPMTWCLLHHVKNTSGHCCGLVHPAIRWEVN